MSSTKRIFRFHIRTVIELADISYRAMMGEYILYYKSKVIGSIYDDRFWLNLASPLRR